MNRSILIAIVIALAVTLWVVSGQFGEPPEMAAVTVDTEQAAEDKPPQSVRVLASSAEMTPEVIRIFGRTEADRAVTVRVETAGSVETVTAIEGDRLDKDAEIVRLDMEDRESTLGRAQGELDFRDKAYRAAEALSKKQFSSEVSLAEDAAALAAARADVAAARLDIARTRVRMPFEGVVDRVMVDAGDVVAIGDPVAYVADLDPIVVAIGVSEQDIIHIHKGDNAMVKVVGHEPLPGAVRFVSRSGDNLTRTFRVEIAIDNADLTIAEGLTAEVRLEAERRSSHKITPSALTLDDDGRLGVMTVDDADAARFKPVEIVRDEVDGVWITGLDAETRIIVTGQSFVTEGERVAPVSVTD